MIPKERGSGRQHFIKRRFYVHFYTFLKTTKYKI